MGEKLDKILMCGAFSVNAGAGIVLRYAESKGYSFSAVNPLFTFIPITAAGMLAGRLEARRAIQEEASKEGIKRKSIAGAIAGTLCAGLANLAGYYVGGMY